MNKPINPKRLESEQPILEAIMAKTVGLIFLLGLMVSCASYHNDREISSVDQHEQAHGYYERASMGSNR
jgi:hypothetical protein